MSKGVIFALKGENMVLLHATTPPMLLLGLVNQVLRETFIAIEAEPLA